METGFNLYFLLNVFEEAEKPEEDTQDFKETKDKKSKKPLELQSLVNDNIVTKWAEVVVSVARVVAGNR